MSLRIHRGGTNLVGLSPISQRIYDWLNDGPLPICSIVNLVIIYAGYEFRGVHTATLHSGPVNTLTALECGLLAPYAADNLVRVWAPYSDTCVWTLAGHTQHIT